MRRIKSDNQVLQSKMDASSADFIQHSTEEGKLIYPGMLVGNKSLSVEEMLPVIDGQYTLAVQSQDGIWIECLQEHLVDRMAHDLLITRYPHLDPSKNVLPKEHFPYLLFYYPGSPWWDQVLNKEYRFHAYLSGISADFRNRASRLPPELQKESPTGSRLKESRKVETKELPGPAPDRLPSPDRSPSLDTAPGPALDRLPSPDTRPEPTDSTINLDECAEIRTAKGTHTKKYVIPRPRKARSACPIAQCGKRPNCHLRDHIYAHMPVCLRISSNSLREKYTRNRAHSQAKCLCFFSRHILGTVDLSRLVAWVNDQAKEANYEWNLPKHVFVEMKHFAQLMKWPTEDGIKVGPANHPASLLHWRALALLMNALPDHAVRSQEWHSLMGTEQSENREVGQFVTPHLQSPEGPISTETSPSFQSGNSSGTKKLTKAKTAFWNNRRDILDESLSLDIVDESLPLPARMLSSIESSIGAPSTASFSPFQAFDSHFHLDHLEQRTGKEGHDAIAAVVGRNPKFHVELRGGVSNYCDPTNFHQVRFPANPFFRVAVGIHPRHAFRISETELGQLHTLLCDPRVSAVSEVGLDYSCPQEQWESQKVLLHRILAMGVTGRVLIVCLRADGTNFAAGRPSKECLKIMSDCKVSRHQRIHVHLCDLNHEEVVLWKQSYPECHFGFSSSPERIDSSQQEALKHVPFSRFLLESNAPFLPIDLTANSNSPAYIGEIAQVLAKQIRLDMEDILKMTSDNAVRLYGPWKTETFSQH